MKVKFGEMDLLDSTTFLAFGLGETEVLIQDETDHLRFLLDFVEEKNPQQSLKWEVVDAATLKIRLINWNNPIGSTLL